MPTTILSDLFRRFLLFYSKIPGSVSLEIEFPREGSLLPCEPTKAVEVLAKGESSKGGTSKQ